MLLEAEAARAYGERIAELHAALKHLVDTRIQSGVEAQLPDKLYVARHAAIVARLAHHDPDLVHGVIQAVTAKPAVFTKRGVDRFSNVAIRGAGDETWYGVVCLLFSATLNTGAAAEDFALVKFYDVIEDKPSPIRNAVWLRWPRRDALLDHRFQVMPLTSFLRIEDVVPDIARVGLSGSFDAFYVNHFTWSLEPTWEDPVDQTD